MSVLPEGEQLRKAIKWISDMRTENPEAGLPILAIAIVKSVVFLVLMFYFGRKLLNQ